MRELTDNELDAVAAGLIISPPGADGRVIIISRKLPENVPDAVPPLRKAR